MTVTRRRFLGATAATAGVAIMQPGRVLAEEDPSLVPFQWGVASGDPLFDRVIIWTRIDPARGAAVDTTWIVARSADLSDPVATGSVTASANRDHTVKIDVVGLDPDTTYFYAFEVGTVRSMVGRTRTAPTGAIDRIRLGLASCAKFNTGYYNAYAGLADEDINAVLHLGDYIYESLGDVIAGREHDPDHETVSLDDYRTRYRQYRCDPDLQRMHQQHPTIHVWDDHETTDNSWRGGAGNHQPDSEGDWNQRKAVAQQVFAEYLPIRLPEAGDTNRIWRSLPFGDLLELVMMDTRLERDEQVSNAAAGSTADNDDPNRVMLSDAQRTFVYDRLANSAAQWKILGQQVLMAHWRVVPVAEELAPVVQGLGLTAKSGVFYNSDGWDGYTVERDKLFAHLADNNITDVVTVTGDIHSSWANELVQGANVLNDPVAVEFVTPAISTTPFASLVNGEPFTAGFEAQFIAANPWVRYVDMDPNGYTVLDITPARAQAEWHFVTVDARPGVASDGPAWYTDTGTSQLLEGTHTDPRANAPAAAPAPVVVDRSSPSTTTGVQNTAASTTPTLPATGGPSLLALGLAASAAGVITRRAARGAAADEKP